MKTEELSSVKKDKRPRKTGDLKPPDPDPITQYDPAETAEIDLTNGSLPENIEDQKGTLNSLEISNLDTDSSEKDGDRPPTVMIVEDDNIVSTMLRHLLERRGYNIEIASDGRGAANLIKSKIPPALIILDVMLPFVDGFELIRQIRDNEEWMNVPIIMLTVKTREEDVVRALESGANDYIVKPFHPQELIARVKRFVRN